MFARRQWLMKMQTGLRIVGSRSSPHTRRLLEFAVRNRLPHAWLDTDTDPAAAVVLARHHTPASLTPVVVMRGGELLRQPSNAELARAAGIGTGPAAGKTYDVAIIGAGPAGLAAAVYGALEGLSTALVDALAVGGQIGTTSTSRTTWASRSGSAATSSPSAPTSKCCGSGRQSCCPSPPPGCPATPRPG